MPPPDVPALAQSPRGYRGWRSRVPPRTGRAYLGTAADLTVAMVLAFGSAAAGSRLLWPVLIIAAYYAAGVLLTGTSRWSRFSAVDDVRPTSQARAHSGRHGRRRRLLLHA